MEEENKSSESASKRRKSDEKNAEDLLEQIAEPEQAAEAAGAAAMETDGVGVPVNSPMAINENNNNDNSMIPKMATDANDDKCSGGEAAFEATAETLPMAEDAEAAGNSEATKIRPTKKRCHVRIYRQHQTDSSPSSVEQETGHTSSSSSDEENATSSTTESALTLPETETGTHVLTPGLAAVDQCSADDNASGSKSLPQLQLPFSSSPQTESPPTLPENDIAAMKPCHVRIYRLPQSDSSASSQLPEEPETGHNSSLTSDEGNANGTQRSSSMASFLDNFELPPSSDNGGTTPTSRAQQRLNRFNDTSSDTDSSDDSDDDEDDIVDVDTDEQVHVTADNAVDIDALNEVMSKPKQAYAWNSTYELMRREHGLSGNGRTSLRNGMSTGFNARFYSSRHVVERMKLSHCLRKHSGCVNCLNFNRSGNLLVTGSDDKRIIVWDWSQNKPLHVFKSGHTENIFQTKFLDNAGLEIVSASRDGQVRLSTVPSSGGKVQTSCIYKHRGSVNKLVVCPQNRGEIISVGEDGYVRFKDLRSDSGVTDMLKVVTGSKKRKVRLFSISHHPFAPEICVCGCDNFVRVYDKRNISQTVHEMCPSHLVDTSIPQITCSVYNCTGSEILSSYSDDHIYLFNNKTYKTGEYLHRYRGHYNHRTIKGVNFFGPNSEYVISGSDCGNIFFWDKNTEAILNFMLADSVGVVNCLEPHPSIPVLATSGLDHNIKIWTPNSESYPPDLTKLKNCVKRNLRRSVIEEANEFDDRQFHYFIRQYLRHPTALADLNDDDSNSNGTDAGIWSSGSSSSSSDDELHQMGGIPCRNQ